MIRPGVSANMVAVYRPWATLSDQTMITVLEGLYNYFKVTAIKLVVFPHYPVKE
jgi:hypothetical protein